MARTTWGERKRLSSSQKKEQRTAYLFLAPQFLGMICFIMIPAVISIILCFTQWDLISAMKFTGFENFNAVFEDGRFGKSLLNTLLFTIGVLPITIGVSLGLALLTNHKLRGLGFYKACFFLPMATASVAIVLVWYWIYAPNIGVINYFLSWLGVSGPNWLTDPYWARWAIIIMAVWQNMGYYFLIFLAGLKGIPQDYYEAAQIDGANGWQRFYKITLPLISPTMFFVMITMSINVLNLFQEPMVLTEGGPEYSTYSIVMYIYDLAFRFFRMGEAAVVSTVLFVIVIIITLIQFKLSGKWVFSNDSE